MNPFTHQQLCAAMITTPWHSFITVSPFNIKQTSNSVPTSYAAVKYVYIWKCIFMHLFDGHQASIKKLKIIITSITCYLFFFLVKFNFQPIGWNSATWPTWFSEKFALNQLVCIKIFGFGWFCFVLFEGTSPLKCLYFDGLSRQETIRQHFPMNRSKTGHSYETFIHLYGQYIFICLLSAKKSSPVDLSKLAVTGKFRSIYDHMVLRLFIFSKLVKN